MQMGPLGAGSPHSFHSHIPYINIIIVVVITYGISLLSSFLLFFCFLFAFPCSLLLICEKEGKAQRLMRAWPQGWLPTDRRCKKMPCRCVTSFRSGLEQNNFLRVKLSYQPCRLRDYSQLVAYLPWLGEIHSAHCAQQLKHQQDFLGKLLAYVDDVHSQLGPMVSQGLGISCR